VQIPFTVTVNRAGTTAMLRGLSVNFGEGGIGGKIEGDLEPGEHVLLQIVDSRLQKQLEPRAQVSYRKDNTYGFEFLDVSSQAQSVVRQFCQRLASA
jgi:c-di-GMP-binding flagellar brake protein YcgR